jgi:hypothetical protein
MFSKPFTIFSKFIKKPKTTSHRSPVLLRMENNNLNRDYNKTIEEFIYLNKGNSII